ncbi:Hypothetical predicted protein [Cloeon dipterum]|uniref:Sushi domain-containing protein n=1 Tax=Cloeon dipterum TaxID=197152 RepID=A0A8S1C470_9INSE|nr:Hypothetical predicted protein [Cloeon dipterum]
MSIDLAALLLSSVLLATKCAQSLAPVSTGKLPREQLNNFEPQCSAPAIDGTTYSECTSYPPDRKLWPSHWAHCKCKSCPNNLSTILLCGQDGLWYRHPDEKKPACEKCNECLTDVMRDEYMCPKTWQAGESKWCPCRHDCLDYSVSCTHSFLWAYKMRKTTTNDFVECNARSKTVFLDDDEIKIYKFKNGLVTVSCRDGYVLEGEQNFECEKGVLNGTLPNCTKH